MQPAAARRCRKTLNGPPEASAATRAPPVEATIIHGRASVPARGITDITRIRAQSHSAALGAAARQFFVK